MTNPSKYEKTVTVACVNWSGTWGDRSANLKKMKSLVGQAASAGADIVAFPELALSGYECGEEAKDNKPCLMHHEAAETIPGPASLSLADLGRELGVYVLFGMPERDSAQGQIVYNAAAVVGPEGVIGSYRKIHLSRPPIWTESYCFTPGNRVPVFPTKYGPIGVEICYDFWRVP